MEIINSLFWCCNVFRGSQTQWSWRRGSVRQVRGPLSGRCRMKDARSCSGVEQSGIIYRLGRTSRWMQQHSWVVCCQSGARCRNNLYFRGFSSSCVYDCYLCVQIEGLLRQDVLANIKIVVGGGRKTNLLSPNWIHVKNVLSPMQSLHFLPSITKPTQFFSIGQSYIRHFWTTIGLTGDLVTILEYFL